MVRVGGLSYTIEIGKPAGQRISDLTLLRTAEKIDAGKTYTVSGWASVRQGTQGPAVYDVVSKYLADVKRVRLEPNRRVRVLGAGPEGYEPV
jgi:sulfur-oxidizing protein SoxB